MSYNLSNNIKVLLTVYNLKQPDFGKMIGNSSGATVSNWIKGVATPPLDKLIMICNQFDVSLDNLVFGEVGKPNSGYDEFMKNNHPHLLADEKENYSNGIWLDEDSASDTKKISELGNWLQNNHEQLMKNSFFNMYIAAKQKEYLDFLVKNNLRERFLSSNRPEGE